MSNFSKFIVFIVLCLAIWWGYDKFFAGNVQIPSLTEKIKTEIPEKTETKQEKDNPDIAEKTDEQENSYIYIYMLTTDKNGQQFLKPVKRPLAPGKDRLTQAVKLLLSGPNNIEISKGIYSEVPDSAQLISITNTDDKVIINLSGAFGNGGGSDSTYSRMRQLIKTVLANSDKPVYLHLDGKQADIIGGEGITVTQPLSEKSLDE